jgi:50S ribosomal subunit-associated GTPase HflX
MIDSKKSRATESTVRPKRPESGSNVRRVYINQRIPRVREEMKGLQKELQEAGAGPGPKDAKANRARIYARERMVALRDELKALVAERRAMPKKPGSPADPAIN